MVVSNLFAQPIGAPTPAPAAPTPIAPAQTGAKRFDGALRRAAAVPDRAAATAQNTPTPAHQPRTAAQDQAAKPGSRRAEPSRPDSTTAAAPTTDPAPQTDTTAAQQPRPATPQQSDSRPSHASADQPTEDASPVDETAQVILSQIVVDVAATSGAGAHGVEIPAAVTADAAPQTQSAPTNQFATNDGASPDARMHTVPHAQAAPAAPPRIGLDDGAHTEDAELTRQPGQRALGAVRTDPDTHGSARADQEVRVAEQRTPAPERAARPDGAAPPHTAERAPEPRSEPVRAAANTIAADKPDSATEQGVSADGDRNERRDDAQSRGRTASRTLDRADAADRASFVAPARAATKPAQPAEPAPAQPLSATIADRAQPNAQGLYGTTQPKTSLAQPNQQESAQQAFEASVARGLGAAVRQRGGTITVQLQPEALGSLRIRMDIERGVVTARFDASTAQARDLLTKNMEMLRTSLEARGLSVDKLQVTLASPGSGQGGQAGQQHASGEQGRAHHHDAGDGQSRGAFDRRQDADSHRDGGRDERHGTERAEPFETTPDSREQRAERVRLAVDAFA